MNASIRQISVATGWVVLGAVAALGVAHLVQGKVAAYSGDSPINIAGGSIYATTTGSWNPQTGISSYTTTATNIGQITSSLFPNLPAQVDGWKITISNTDSNGRPKAGAVTICSNSSCNFKDLGDKTTVYFLARLRSRFHFHPRLKEIRFHDRDCDGDDDTATENPDCDLLSDVRIDYTVAGAQNSQSASCATGNVAGYCLIGIGK